MKKIILCVIIFLSFISITTFAQVHQTDAVTSSNEFYAAHVLSNANNPLEIYIKGDTFRIVKNKNNFEIFNNKEKMYTFENNKLYDINKDIVIDKKRNTFYSKDIEGVFLLKKGNWTLLNKNTNSTLLIISLQRNSHKRIMNIAANTNLNNEFIFYCAIQYYIKEIKSSDDWFYGVLGAM